MSIHAGSGIGFNYQILTNAINARPGGMNRMMSGGNVTAQIARASVFIVDPSGPSAGIDECMLIWQQWPWRIRKGMQVVIHPSQRLMAALAHLRCDSG